MSIKTITAKPIAWLIALTFNLTVYSQELDLNRTDSKADKFVAIFFDSQEKSQKLLLASIQDQFYSHTQSLQPIYINSFQLSELALKSKLNEELSCALLIGSGVSKRILATRPELPLFAVNVSRLELNKFHNIYKPLSVFVTGIYEEQSLLRQILLAKSIKTTLDSISLLYNQADKYYLNEDRELIEKLGITLNYGLLQNPDSPQNFLLRHGSEDESFLMLSNNKTLFSQSRLASLVLTANKTNTRVIGNRLIDSEQGALASVYTPDTSLALEALEGLNKICQLGERPEPTYASNYSIDINQRIALASKTQALDPGQLYKRISKLEQEYKSQESNLLQNNQKDAK